MTTQTKAIATTEPVIDAVLPFAGVGISFAAMLAIIAVLAPVAMMVG
jgi:hypothetical protein